MALGDPYRRTGARTATRGPEPPANYPGDRQLNGHSLSTEQGRIYWSQEGADFDLRDAWYQWNIVWGQENGWNDEHLSPPFVIAMAQVELLRIEYPELFGLSFDIDDAGQPDMETDHLRPAGWQEPSIDFKFYFDAQYAIYVEAREARAIVEGDPQSEAWYKTEGLKQLERIAMIDPGGAAAAGGFSLIVPPATGEDAAADNVAHLRTDNAIQHLQLLEDAGLDLDFSYLNFSGIYTQPTFPSPNSPVPAVRPEPAPLPAVSPMLNNPTYMGVVGGWNQKLNSSSQAISALVPFIDLYAVFGQDDLIYKETGNKYTAIKNRLSKVRFYGPPIAGTVSPPPQLPAGITQNCAMAKVAGNNESQLSRGSLIMNNGEPNPYSSFFGQPGINDLSITKGSANGANIKFDLSITLPNPEIINEKFEYSKLMLMNSTFLLIYGWNISNGPYVAANYPPVITPGNTLDQEVPIQLNGPNGGFWNAVVISLYKMDFNFDNTGQLIGKLSFLTGGAMFLGTISTESIGSRMLQSLKEVPDPESNLAQRMAAFEYQGGIWQNGIPWAPADDNREEVQSDREIAEEKELAASRLRELYRQAAAFEPMSIRNKEGVLEEIVITNRNAFIEEYALDQFLSPDSPDSENLLRQTGFAIEWADEDYNIAIADWRARWQAQVDAGGWLDWGLTDDSNDERFRDINTAIRDTLLSEVMVEDPILQQMIRTYPVQNEFRNAEMQRSADENEFLVFVSPGTVDSDDQYTTMQVEEFGNSPAVIENQGWLEDINISSLLIQSSSLRTTGDENTAIEVMPAFGSPLQSRIMSKFSTQANLNYKNWAEGGRGIIDEEVHRLVSSTSTISVPFLTQAGEFAVFPAETRSLSAPAGSEKYIPDEDKLIVIEQTNAYATGEGVQPRTLMGVTFPTGVNLEISADTATAMEGDGYNIWGLQKALRGIQFPQWGSALPGVQAIDPATGELIERVGVVEIDNNALFGITLAGSGSDEEAGSILAPRENGQLVLPPGVPSEFEDGTMNEIFPAVRTTILKSGWKIVESRQSATGPWKELPPQQIIIEGDEEWTLAELGQYMREAAPEGQLVQSSENIRKLIDAIGIELGLHRELQKINIGLQDIEEDEVTLNDQKWYPYRMPVYFFLGSVLEALREVTNDNVKFYYSPIPTNDMLGSLNVPLPELNSGDQVVMIDAEITKLNNEIRELTDDISELRLPKGEKLVEEEIRRSADEQEDIAIRLVLARAQWEDVFNTYLKARLEHYPWARPDRANNSHSGRGFDGRDKSKGENTLYAYYDTQGHPEGGNTDDRLNVPSTAGVVPGVDSYRNVYISWRNRAHAWGDPTPSASGTAEYNPAANTVGRDILTADMRPLAMWASYSNWRFTSISEEEAKAFLRTSGYARGSPYGKFKGTPSAPIPAGTGIKNHPPPRICLKNGDQWNCRDYWNGPDLQDIARYTGTGIAFQATDQKGNYIHPSDEEPSRVRRDEATTRMTQWLWIRDIDTPGARPRNTIEMVVNQSGGSSTVPVAISGSVVDDFIYMEGPYPNERTMKGRAVTHPDNIVAVENKQRSIEKLLDDRKNITLEAQFKTLDIKTTYEIPLNINTVSQILTNEGRAPAHNLLRKLLEAVKETIPALRLAMRPGPSDPSYIDIFPAAINMDGVIQEVFSEMSIDATSSDKTYDARRSIEAGRGAQSDLGSSYNITSNKVMVCQFGQADSLVENFGLSSKIDPNAFTSYRLPAIVGGAAMNVTNIIRDDPAMFEEVLNDMAAILKDGVGTGIEHLKALRIVTTDSTGNVTNVNRNRLSELLTTSDVPSIEKIAGTLIEDLMSQNVQLYNKVMLLQQSFFTGKEEGDISSGGGDVRMQGSKFYGTVLSTFLRTATLTIHGTTGLNVFDLVYLKGLLSGVEGLYLVSNVNESLAASSFTTTLECKLVEYTNNNAQTNPMAYRGTASLAALAAEAERIQSDPTLGQDDRFGSNEEQKFSVLAEYIRRDDIAAGRIPAPANWFPEPAGTDPTPLAPDAD